MTQSLYLHRQIVDVLTCYGTLDDVINRILAEAAEGKFDVMHKPACPGREGAGRYNINIVEPNYLELLSAYGPFCSKISIRRLVYWFVENEIYEELEWTPINNFRDRHAQLLNTKLSNALTELEKAKRYACNRTKLLTDLSNICEELTILLENLKNGT